MVSEHAAAHDAKVWPMSSDMEQRYRDAHALVPERLPGLMRNRTVDPQWTGDGDRFWYRREDGFVLVDPDTFTREAIPSPPVTDARTPGTLTGPGGVELFLDGHDLWLRTSEGEHRLTKTGEPGYAWAAAPAHTRAMIPMAAQHVPLPPMMTSFSPSGRTVFTARLDEREVPVHPFVEQLPADRAKPRLRTVPYHHVDETPDAQHQLAIVDVGTGDTLTLDVSPDLTGSLAGVGADAVTWAEDESCVYLLAHTTGARTAALHRIDVLTGEISAVVSETAEPIYEPNTHLYSLPLIRVLPRSRQVVWFSQRDGWGHLYRYCLDTGECLNQITSGELVARDILRIDDHEVLLVAGSAEDGGNPYWRRLYRAALDGSGMTLLTPEPADHELRAPTPSFFSALFGAAGASSISPSGRYFVDHMSTVADPPQILLRETESGAVVGVLESTDISGLLAAGYTVPEQFRVGDIWGSITVPANPVDPSSIPVIDLMYAGFQVVNQPSGFLAGGGNAAWSQMSAAYAALGFATVVLDGRGTPGRGREFRQWTHGQVDEPRGLDDHVATIRALAERYPALDLDRVGVTGHSYGGYNSVRSMLHFPEFFKVAVSSAGVHDALKLPYGSWDWHLGEQPHDPAALRALGNLHLADRLQGKLLLLCGDLDVNVTIDHTLALVQALIAADKRFDLKVWAGVDHYGGVTPYMRGVMWDYFVEHLLGGRPPRTPTAR